MSEKNKSSCGCFTIIAIPVWIILLPLRLIITPIYNSIKQSYLQTRSGPKKPGRTFLLRRPKLSNPEQAATYVLQNLTQLTFEQVGEIEKEVRKLGRDSPSALVLYGCRITHPVIKMKSLKSIEERWTKAWCGIDMGIWTLGYEKKWIKACSIHWLPIYLNAIENNLPKNKTLAEVTSNYYPEINSVNNQ